MDAKEVGERLAAETEKAGGAWAWCQPRGIHPTEVSGVINGSRPPSKRILEELGLEKVKTVTYRERQPAAAA